MGNFKRGGDRPGGGFKRGFGGGGSRFGGKPSFGGRPSFGGGRRDGDRPMFSAICSECGNDCQVPFKPTGERPVFCSACFGKQQDGGGRPNKFGGDQPRFEDRGPRPQRFDDQTLHTAVCSKCSKECQVPFKPMPGKPVFCNDCFEKPGQKETGELLRQVEALHAKVDKLMKMLSPDTVKEKTVESEIKTESSDKKTKKTKLKNTTKKGSTKKK